MAKEELLTTFLIFESHEDEQWSYVGKKVARDRDHAARLYYADDDRTTEIKFVAISVNAFKPRVRKVVVPQPKISFEEGEVAYAEPPPARKRNPAPVEPPQDTPLLPPVEDPEPIPATV